MGDFGDGPAASAGDLAYITDDVPEQDKIYELSDSFDTVGNKMSVVIEEKRKFVISRIALAPTKSPTALKCDADIKFADRVIGNLFYDTSASNFAHDYIRPLSLHGDGVRRLEIDVTRFYENITSHDNFMRVLLMGFYKDTPYYDSFPIRKIRAVEKDADTILLYWDAPLDNGGKPITGYRIVSSRKPDMSESVELNPGYAQQENPDEVEIMYAHGSTSDPLDDNTAYYYQVYPVNADGPVDSAASPIVSATTLVDIPHQPTLTLTKVSENQVLVEINNLEIDTGGVPLDGLKIERKDEPDQRYTTIRANTKSPTYVDTILPQVKSTYVVSAINTAGKTSIPSAPQSITLGWNAPTLDKITLDDNKNPKIKLVDPGTNTKHDIEYYLIERSFEDSGQWSQIIQVNKTVSEWTDKTVQPAKDYSYRIRIQRNNTLSPYSNIESISIPSRPPDPPQNLRSTKISDKSVSLEWNEPQNDGGNPTAGYRIQYSESGSFAPLVTVLSDKLDTKAVITGLKPETTYYLRVYAYSDRYLLDNPTSNVISVRTSSAIFGTKNTDYVVNPGSVATFNAGELVEFRDLTIKNGGILQLNGAILKVSRNYAQEGTGKIVVLAHGCAGGKAGTTSAGSGGPQTARGRHNYQRSPNPGTEASKTLPGIVTRSCTNEIFASSLLTSMLIPAFVPRFRTQINGGKGSSGTDAQSSGNGGNSGSGGRYANSWHVGLRGGNGAKSADGVPGVRGGGKVALFINNIVDKITVEAKGLPGNDGNRGTGTLGQAGDTRGRPSWALGQRGGNASIYGTLGSEGSDGGIVYFLYSTATSSDFAPSIDVSGGIGGRNGGTSTGAHPLTARADSGDDGLSLVANISEL